MIRIATGTRRSLIVLAIAAGTSLATPAMAQDNQQSPPPQATSQPVSPTTPPAQTVPEPVPIPAPAPAPSPAPVQTTPPAVSPAPVTPPPITRTTPPSATPPAQGSPAPSPTPIRRSTPAPTPPPTASAPTQASPAPATTPVSPTPTDAGGSATVANAVDPAPPAAPAPGFDTIDTTPAANTTDVEAPAPQRGFPVYLVGAILLFLAAIAALVLFLRRRRGDTAEGSDEPAYHAEAAAVEPQDAALPADAVAPADRKDVAGPAAVASAAMLVDPAALAEQEAAPADSSAAEAAEPTMEVEEVAADAADVDALAAAAVPSDDRPWLEFALRPVRAGTNVVDAVVEFELTVGNAGAVAADDVRVAAWLLSAGPNQDEDIRRFLEATPDEAVMPGFDVAPGDGRRVDATISLPKTGLNVVTARDRPFFVPIVIADARYALPGGGEGRTSAAFVVGTVKAGVEKLGPIWLDRGPRMHDDIEARLHGEPTRA